MYDFTVGILFRLNTAAILCSIYTTQHDFVGTSSDQFFSKIFISGLGRGMDHRSALRIFFLLENMILV